MPASEHDVILEVLQDLQGRLARMEAKVDELQRQVQVTEGLERLEQHRRTMERMRLDVRHEIERRSVTTPA